jgi:hypothetical protein
MQEVRYTQLPKSTPKDPADRKVNIYLFFYKNIVSFFSPRVLQGLSLQNPKNPNSQKVQINRFLSPTFYLNKIETGLGVVIHICNPSYSEIESIRISVWG